VIGSTASATDQFLAAVAAQVESATVHPGDTPASCTWIRIPIRDGFVGVWDAEELGEHGVYVQAWTPEPLLPQWIWPDLGDGPAGPRRCGEFTLTPVDAPAFICERATVDEAVKLIRRYLQRIDRRWDYMATGQATVRELQMQPVRAQERAEAWSWRKQRQLQSQTKKPGLIGRYLPWLRSGQVP
jgi:hypothetical protein